MTLRPMRSRDAIADADRIADPLLIIHGMSDDNVFFENSSELIAKLQHDDRPFEMMLYPGETHRSGGPMTLAHRWNTIMRLSRSQRSAGRPALN